MLPKLPSLKLITVSEICPLILISHWNNIILLLSYPWCIPLVSYKSLCTKVIRLAFYKCHGLNILAADVMNNTNSFVVQSQGPVLQMLASRLSEAQLHPQFPSKNNLSINLYQFSWILSGFHSLSKWLSRPNRKHQITTATFLE